MARLPRLIDSGDVTLPAVAALLDGLSGATQVQEVRSLSAHQIERLFLLASSAPPLKVDELVAGIPDGETVRYCGKNSLPARTTMEKRLARHRGEVVGYNEQPLAFATGPGYFTCTPFAGRPNEVLLDYTLIPTTAPRGWPEPRSNARGISHLVYKNLHDYLRRVSRDVVIGETTHLGKPVSLRMGKHFVMARL